MSNIRYVTHVDVVNVCEHLETVRTEIDANGKTTEIKKLVGWKVSLRGGNAFLFPEKPEVEAGDILELTMQGLQR